MKVIGQYKEMLKGIYVLPILLYLLLPIFLVFISCEKEIPRYAEVRQYYQESTTLKQTSLDSVRRFSQKVDAFIILHPIAKDDPLYPEIEENIRQARIIFRMNDGSWGDDIHLDFDFSEENED